MVILLRQNIEYIHVAGFCSGRSSTFGHSLFPQLALTCSTAIGWLVLPEDVLSSQSYPASLCDNAKLVVRRQKITELLLDFM